MYIGPIYILYYIYIYISPTPKNWYQYWQGVIGLLLLGIGVVRIVSVVASGQ